MPDSNDEIKTKIIPEPEIPNTGNNVSLIIGIALIGIGIIIILRGLDGQKANSNIE